MVKLWDAEDSVLSDLTLLTWAPNIVALQRILGPQATWAYRHLQEWNGGRTVRRWEHWGFFCLFSWWFSFTNGMIFFCLKKDFAPSLTTFMGYTASYQVRRWRPRQPTFLEFSSIICNTRWHTQDTLYSALHALYENSFIIQAQEHSSSEIIQSLHWFHWKFGKDSRNFPQSQLADQEEVHIFKN